MMESINIDHIPKLKHNCPCPSTKTTDERFILHLLPAKKAPDLNCYHASRGINGACSLSSYEHNKWSQSLPYPWRRFRCKLHVEERKPSIVHSRGRQRLDRGIRAWCMVLDQNYTRKTDFRRRQSCITERASAPLGLTWQEENTWYWIRITHAKLTLGGGRVA
jgi:hypothetical protein